MGRSYAYECPKCNFTAKVCGGEDSGADCFLRTFSCHVCRRLYDVVIYLRLPTTLALKIRTAHGAAHSRLPRKLPKRELKTLVPSHVVFSTQLADINPHLPDGLLLGKQDPRWVELAIACPAAGHHRLELWKDPGKCPRCGTFLDKSLMPFQVWD